MSSSDSHNDCHDCGEHHHEPHVVPDSLFISIFVALLVLTAVTVGVTYFDFGATINIVVAMAVASLKALLVVLFFMHLKYEDSDVVKYAIFPIVLLGVFLAGIFLDAPTRSYKDRFTIDSVEHAKDSHH